MTPTVSSSTKYEPLAGPFDTPPSADGIRPSPAVLDLVHGQVRALLQSSPAYYQLDADKREEMEQNLAKIAAYSAALVQEDWALSKQLGQTPVLVQRHKAPEPIAQAAAGKAQKTEKPAEEFAPRAVSRVAQITRETLNAVAFPKFVADLIKGTYFAIVQATFQQMEAFGKLLANVAQTVDEFMVSNITENQARDYLVSAYPSHFEIDTSNEDGPKVEVRDNAPDSKPDFKASFGLDEDVEMDDDEVEEKLVPAARRKLAKNRHEMLAAMVMMGIQRIVVTSGRLNAKMLFHIDAHDTGSASIKEVAIATLNRPGTRGQQQIWPIDTIDMGKPHQTTDPYQRHPVRRHETSCIVNTPQVFVSLAFHHAMDARDTHIVGLSPSNPLVHSLECHLHIDGTHTDTQNVCARNHQRSPFSRSYGED